MTLAELIPALWHAGIPLRLNEERRLVLGPGWDWKNLPSELQAAILEHRKLLEAEIVLGGPMAARLSQMVCGECFPEVKPASAVAFDRDQTFWCMKCQWSTGHYPRMRESAPQMRGLKGA